MIDEGVKEAFLICLVDDCSKMCDGFFLVFFFSTSVRMSEECFLELFGHPRQLYYVVHLLEIIQLLV